MGILQSSKSPILSVGTFGTHLDKNPAGTFSFFGTVHGDIRSKCFETFDDAAKAFKGHFLSQDVDFQREHAPNLRNDFFSFIYSQDK